MIIWTLSRAPKRLKNRLVIHFHEPATLAYDDRSRRIQKIANGKMTTFRYDDWNMIRETTNGEATYSIWGLDLSGTLQGAGGVGGLLAEIKGNSVRYPFCDGNGNITDWVDGDGEVIAHYEYDPFGNEMTGESPSSFGFSSKPYDSTLGLYYYGYRFYSPAMGRWINRDPMGEAGGINIYGILANNLVDEVDYLGLFDWSQWWKKVEKWISGSIADTAEDMYNFIQDHQLSDDKIRMMNIVVDLVSRRASALIDTNTKTMGWRDLAMAWFFEQGPRKYYFQKGDRTTADIRVHYGAVEALEKARSKCRGGVDFIYKWGYGRKEFWRSLVEIDTAAEFLGSYTVRVQSKDCCTYDITAENSSTWESATRFRRAEKPGGTHQGIIQNRMRGGPGIHLGGNMDQEWKWTECVGD